MSVWLKRHRLVSIFLAGILLAVPSAIVNYDLLISMALAAQKKVSELTAITGANTATDDDFLIVDTDATESKRITRAELEEAIWDELNATDGGVLLGSGANAPTSMAVLSDGEFIVGDGTTDPVAESGATARTSMGAAGTADVNSFTNTQTFDALVDIGTVETFADLDATPDVSSGIYFNTFTNTLTITDFGGTPLDGQLLYVNSQAAITFDCTASGLDCGSTDIVTASGDTTIWLFDGTNWDLLAFKDQSADMGVAGANTNAETICAGTTTYLDGEGNCDDIAGVYENELDDSAGLLAALSDETGTGVAVFGTNPTFTTGVDLPADAINAITEIASGLKTGADLVLVTGTAGTSTHCAQWNVDGDLVTAGAVCGTGGEAAFQAESVPGVNPTATGTDAIGIGDGAVAGDAAGDNAVLAIGANATATGANSVAIGQNTDATGISAIAIGGHSTDASSADATANSAVAIGAFSEASATGAFALGVDAKANAADAVAIGRSADASGANCVAIGGNAVDTDSADCSGADSVALGAHILADDIGEFAFASGEFAVQSDAHTSIFVLRNNTTDATQTEIFSDGSAGAISVPSDCTVSFRINVVARQTDADGFSAGYLIAGVIDNNAGTTALVGSVTTTTVGEDVAGWDVTATADDTNDSINVLVTGAVGDAVRWVARVELAEVCG